MISLEQRLARDIEEEYKRNVPFSQFQTSYFMYKRCVNTMFTLGEYTDVVLERKMDTLYLTKMKEECKK